MMMRALALVSVVTLAGCAVGPDFKMPKWDIGGSWMNKDEVAATARPLPIEWWKQIGDPVLDQLVGDALANGASVRVAQARVVQARALRLQALSGLFPEVSAGGRAQYAEASQNTGGAAAIAANRQNKLFTSGFDASWEIDIFGGARRGAEAAYADWMAARADEADARLSLVADVAATYMDYRLADERIRLAEENVKAQERTVQLTEARNRVGDVSGLDVAQARSQMLATRAQLPLYRQQKEIARGTLAVLVDKTPTTFVVSDSIALAGATLPNVPAGLPSSLLERRPDVIAAQKRWHGATARIGEAEAARFPQFNLTAGIGTQSSQLTNLLANGSGFWNLIPAVSMPLIDGGARRAQVNLAKGIETENEAMYRQSVLVALRDVESALAGVREERLRFEDLNSAARNSGDAFRYAQRRYQAGEEGLLSVLTAQGSLTSAQDARATSQVQLIKNWVALVKALGGGFASPTAVMGPVSATVPISPSFTTADSAK